MSLIAREEYLNKYCGEYITGFEGIKDIYGIDLIYTEIGDGLLVNFNYNNSTETVILSLNSANYLIEPNVFLSKENLKELNYVLNNIWDDIRIIYKIFYF